VGTRPQRLGLYVESSLGFDEAHADPCNYSRLKMCMISKVFGDRGLDCMCLSNPSDDSKFILCIIWSVPHGGRKKIFISFQPDDIVEGY
jgi:hypothetical protein